METKIKLIVKQREDKEVYSWTMKTFFELDGEEYDATINYDDQAGFTLYAYEDQEKLHNQLRKLDIGVWDICTEILDAEVSE